MSLNFHFDPSSVRRTLSVFCVSLVLGSLLFSSLAFPEGSGAAILRTLQNTGSQTASTVGGSGLASITAIADARNYSALLGTLFAPGSKVKKDKTPTFDRIDLLPGDLTVLQGELIDYVATAYRGDQPSSGVLFRYTIAREGSEPTRVLLNGRFEAAIPGRYVVRATANGFYTETSLTVVENRGYAVMRLLRKPEHERTQAEQRLINEWIASGILKVHPVSSRDNNTVSIERRRFAEKERAAIQHTLTPESADPSGWDGTNYGTADDPINWVGRVNGSASEKGAANGNYNFSAPAVNLDGRGALDINLNLEYNSRLWSKSGTEMTYNGDSGYPAPGWNLGFGKMFHMGSTGGCMLVAPDGTRRSYSGATTSSTYGYTYAGQTTDGSLIDYSCNYYSSGGTTVLGGWARYPDGTTVTFGSPNAGFDQLFPTRIQDAHGNYTSISYVSSHGPEINTITDTLGRTITFNYNGTSLRSISGPGYNGTTRQFIRFEYFNQTINTSGLFTGLTTNVANSTPSQLKAIFYPTTNSGYWFGETNSYSPYGNIRRIISQRGMNWNSGPDTIDAGTSNRDEVYDYPTTASSLSDSPGYTTHTETFDGMDTSALVTSYIASTAGSVETIAVTRPDSSKLIQKSHVTGTYTNGLQFENRIENSSSTVLDKTVTTLDLGAYSSYRPTSIEHTDDKNQVTKTEFTYGSVYNQVSAVKSYDYGGTTLYREKRFTYENGSLYTANHIFNLVKTTEDYDNSNTRLTRTVYGYDGGALVAASGIVQHDYTYDPDTTETVAGSCLVWDPDGAGCSYEGQLVETEQGTRVCACETYEQVSAFNWVTAYRGNLTNVTTYTDGTAATGAISHDYTYDIAGNQRTATTNCCQQIGSSYSTATQYLVPDSVTKGSSNPVSPDRITQSFTYDANTKVPTTVTDFNGLVTTIAYDGVSRPTLITLSSGGKKTITYGDSTLSQTELVQKSTGEGSGTVSNSSVYTNGRGQPIKSTYQAGSSNYNGTQTKYDVMGRQWKVSMPYDTGSSPSYWTEFAYDHLSRPTTQTAPDGSTTTRSYSSSQPSSAASNSGTTVLSTDAWGRQRWTRTDGFGRLVEAVEPNPAETTAAVSASGNLATSYSFDHLDRITGITQGSQSRSFKYDSLGRLTRQKLAEQSATINDSGTFVGSGGSGANWSDAFVYDTRNNITQRTDARGVKTNFSYLVSSNPDPLNRLQSISYDTSTADTTYTINAAPTVTFEYMTTGDTTRVKKVITASTVTEENSFDAQGRVSQYKMTFDSRTSYPFTTDYAYDTAHRLSQVTYPAQYSMTGTPRKAIAPSYDQASRLTQLNIDGSTYLGDISYNTASQVTSLKTGAATPNPRIESYSYDSQTGLLAGQTVKNTGLTSTYLDLAYTYSRGNSYGSASGKTGQLTKIVDNLDHNRDKLYEFDSLGRIMNAKGGTATGASSVTANWTQTYSYDRYGNKTGVTATGVDQNSASIAADGLTSVTASTSTNRITTSGWEYDLTGNLIRGQNASGVWQKFEYDAAGRLKKVKDDSNNVLETYTYGATREKLLVEPTGGDPTYYVWGGQSIIAEYIDTGSSVRYSKSYIYAGSRLLMTATKASSSTETKEFHHPDRLGTQLVTDGGAGTSYRQTTFPFGTPITAETTGNSNQVFTSYDRSAGTGLDYAVNRTYSKGQSRFTQVDPLAMGSASLGNPQSNNLYAYVQNMPTDFVDPSGLNDEPPIPMGTTWGKRWDWSFWLWRMFGNRGGIPTATGDPGGGGGSSCDLTKFFGDPGSYFFDNTNEKNDSILGTRPGKEHSHLYGSPTDNSVVTNVYAPKGGTLVQPATRIPGQRNLGSARNEEGDHTANYALIQYSRLGILENVTVAVFHIDNFNPQRQTDGRLRLGTIGFSGAEEGYGSGGALGRNDGKKGGHSHIELLRGKKWNLQNKILLNFRDICP